MSAPSRRTSARGGVAKIPPAPEDEGAGSRLQFCRTGDPTWHTSRVAPSSCSPAPRSWVGPEAAAQPPAARPPIPVILDTDIGDDIDDTWALILALKSPELDVKLVVTDFGNTEQRARLVARVLELAGRTDIPIGIGIKENDDPGPQAEWVKGYDLAKYPGRVYRDGVQALIDTAMASPEPMTLIAIGPPPNLKAALEREPRIAGKLRLAGMYGSIHKGYDGKPKPEPEWNVRANPAAARALLAAPWREAILTPLDTCGRVQLSGERYARVRGSSDPLLRGLVEAFSHLVPEPRLVREGPRLRLGEELHALRLRGRLPRDLARPREDGDDGGAGHGRGA